MTKDEYELPIKFLEEFEQKNQLDWETLVDSSLKGKPAEGLYERETSEGFTLKPIYARNQTTLSNSPSVQTDTISKIREQLRKNRKQASWNIGQNYYFGDVQTVNKDLLEEALTHSSFKNKSNSNQERLEFLGDRVLGLVIAEFLFQSFLSEREGVLTNKFRYLIQNKQCTKIAEKLDIANYLQVGNSEKNKITNSILADSIEALLGAIYLDGGYDESKKVILSLWDEYLNNDEMLNATVSSKNILQEYLHANSLTEATYLVISKDGEDHNPNFLVEVSVDKIGKADAFGKSIKEAEINAAKKFIDEFEIG